VVSKMCDKPRGLVLVTGPTGSGKSTTLAAMIDKINSERHDHILTIEDPIEFVHMNKNCVVNQRELHADTKSFGDALRAALREDPDVVLIGEMRDPDTIVATVSSGLSIGDLCAGYSRSLREHFLGIHLFNPPTAITGCELIAHAGTDPGVVAIVRDFLTSACGREVVECEAGVERIDAHDERPAAFGCSLDQRRDMSAGACLLGGRDRILEIENEGVGPAISGLCELAFGVAGDEQKRAQSHVASTAPNCKPRCNFPSQGLPRAPLR